MKELLKKWEKHKFETVYIVGAGASKAYGYPLGDQLKDKILSLLENDGFFNNCIKQIEESEDSDIQNEYSEIRNLLNEFVSSFRWSGSHTIDSFILKNPKYQNVARICVAYILSRSSLNFINYMAGSSKNEIDSNKFWINNYLNKRVGSSIKEYIELPDCFISFNYDLLLEDHFIRFFHNQSLEAEISKSAPEVVEHLPIFHIYGKLFEPEPLINSFLRNQAPNYRDLLLACEDINFIDRKNRDEYQALRKIIANSNRVVILGYGFDPDNNQVLFNGMKGLQNDFLNTKIYATSVGLSDYEVEKLKKIRFDDLMYHNHHNITEMYKLEMFNEDCNSFLMKHVLVRKFFNDE